MTINATASILLSLYIAVGKKQGVDPSQLNGTLQNDILKEYIARGTHIYPPRHSMRLVTDVFKYCSEHVPSWNTISISGYHMREAGATAVQELGLHLRQRHRLRAGGHRRRSRGRRLCLAPVLLLRRPEQPPRRGRKVPRRPPDVGQDHARALPRHATRARGGSASTPRRPVSPSRPSSPTTT